MVNKLVHVLREADAADTRHRGAGNGGNQHSQGGSSARCRVSRGG